MKRSYKILIIIAIIILVLLVVLFFPNFVNSNKADNITIDNVKTYYGVNEEVIISGKTKAEANIIIFVDDKIGSTVANKKGEWKANLGKLAEGGHNIQVLSEISEEKNSIASAKIIIKDKGLTLISSNFFAGLINKFVNNSPATILVDKNSPDALKGQWKLLNQ